MGAPDTMALLEIPGVKLVRWQCAMDIMDGGVIDRDGQNSWLQLGTKVWKMLPRPIKGN